MIPLSDSVIRYASVLVPVRVGCHESTFDYIVPHNLMDAVRPGALVIVPFSHRILTGCVVDVRSESARATREIIDVLDQSLWPGEGFVDLALWMADEYFCPPGVALRAILLGGLGLRARTSYVFDESLGFDPRPKSTRQVARKFGPGWKEMIERLTERGVVKRHRVYTSLLTAGRLKTTAAAEFTAHGWAMTLPRELTPEQEAACARLTSCEGRHLLFGVAGSGKTEVYLRAVEQRLARGEGSIVLIPEISLTPQTAARFIQRFGSRVAVLHSGLSQGEKYREWRRLRSGEAAVALGARSAVFAPVQNLSLVVIDEEHDRAYKQEEDPKYHARTVAFRRAGTVVLGSATPSVESYYSAVSGDYSLIRMNNRVRGLELPVCSVVDMRRELAEGNRSILSREIVQALNETLKTGHQAILFLNRRGHSTFLLCRECGYVVKCPWCDVSAVYHAANQRLMCHYCSWSQKVPDTCPNCGSRYIRYFGAGTEKVEEEVKLRFPNARVLRMDRDTTRKRGSYQSILSAFRDGLADILVGTQMVSKGHDIPGITLVGVISADVTLNLPDFRASERTFQLLAQVAGRAGRGEAGGRAIIQTYSPDHYAIKTSASLDYDAFYETEVRVRQELNYPPFGRLLGISIRGKSADECLSIGQRVVSSITRSEAGKKVEVLGPAPQAISRIKRVHRWQVLVKAPTPELAHEVGRTVQRELYDKVSLDLDPDNVI